MTDIAILGTGWMGAAVTRRLLAGGHRVTVWNRSPARAYALTAAGADVAATPTDAVATAGVVITLLTDAAAVEAALFGSRHTVAALRPDTVVVQMSTIGPDEVRGIAGRLPASVPLLDAPVGGSVDAAEAGRLAIFAGGPDAVVDLAEPVLRELGTIRRCGPVGAGAALKLVVNTALITALGALHDTLAVADGVGVDRAVALDALAAGPLGGAVRRVTATGASFAIAHAAKDARLALRETPAAPVASAALRLLTRATDQNADVASLIEVENR
ncbi:NAD(P)-dependent oxidoreductase [Micromonospora sp. WMMD1082]|uniref:NAD(P)-dependent oxidoreductase n=1 Tax=Micromonospora sp. WMMD1082 TaxID=3016104 RepID=UPI00241752CB|nr:NAD(P)-dependent oxidoreductase [Micromonospora sp. WMMD1082]MDG4798378.1 NAD(P)-dependent oxidoreductase [Micromonospora sp. WMMD1082]